MSAEGAVASASKAVLNGGSPEVRFVNSVCEFIIEVLVSETITTRDLEILREMYPY